MTFLTVYSIAYLCIVAAHHLLSAQVLFVSFHLLHLGCVVDYFLLNSVCYFSGWKLLVKLAESLLIDINCNVLSGTFGAKLLLGDFLVSNLVVAAVLGMPRCGTVGQSEPDLHLLLFFYYRLLSWCYGLVSSFHCLTL